MAGVFVTPHGWDSYCERWGMLQYHDLKEYSREVIENGIDIGGQHGLDKARHLVQDGHEDLVVIFRRDSRFGGWMVKTYLRMDWAINNGVKTRRKNGLRKKYKAKRRRW